MNVLRRKIAFAVLSLALGSASRGGERLAHAQQRSAADIAQASELLNAGSDLRARATWEGAIEKLRAAHVAADSAGVNAAT